MGSYAILKYGDFEVAQFKSHISLDGLLLFACDDVRHSIERDEDDETEYDHFAFVTDAKTARQRLDSRGIDLESCRGWFDEFRQDEFSYFTDADEYLTITHPVGFDRYIQLLRQAFEQGAERSLYRVIDLAHSREAHDLELSAIAQESLFLSESLSYFYDIAGCILYRCLLEAVPDATVVELDFSELVDSGWIEGGDLGQYYDYYLQRMIRRIELDYRIYGFALDDNPELDRRLRVRIEDLDEDSFIKQVLMPLLDRMGFEHVRKVGAHGPGEFGTDVLPFRYLTPLGTVEYSAVQAKAVAIHGTASKSGNIAELVNQAQKAFSTSFVDDVDNERKRIDRFIIVTNKHITTEARKLIEESFEGNRRFAFLDIDQVVALIKKNDLVQYVLFADTTNRSG